MIMATIDDFNKLDIRVGEIVEVSDFPEARKPSYRILVDFGEEIGTKKSSAQIVPNYTKEILQNKKVLAVVNFPPRQIGPFISEVLILGVPDEEGEVVLVKPGKDVPIGGRLY
jgi:tRNA-binding protein